MLTFQSRILIYVDEITEGKKYLRGMINLVKDINIKLKKHLHEKEHMCVF